ncbi:protein kinase domain-containing protein [Nocardia takedensis]
MERLHDGDPPTIGRYRLLARLGAGAGGVVYLARSPGNRRVAVKVIHPHVMRAAGYRRRFDREVRAARAVGGFHTAAVVDVGWSKGSAWLVTEYVPGPSLRQVVDTHGPLTARSVPVLVRGVAEGLGAIHAAGVVHRDLKPSNVLLTANGPRVVDFGIAAFDDETTATLALGTPGFTAPEQTMGLRPGPSGDMFSLGALLVYAATGRGPFGDGEPATLLHRARTQPPDLGPLAAPLRQIAAACLALDPGERPTPQEVLAGLADVDSATEEWLSHEIIAHRPIPEPEQGPAPPPSRRRAPLLVCAVVSALLLICVLVFVHSAPESPSDAPALSSTPSEPVKIRIPAGTVHDLRLSADGRQLGIATSNGVALVDTDSGAVTRITRVASEDFARISRDGNRLYAFSYASESVGVFDSASGARIDSIAAGRSRAGGLSGDGARLFVAAGNDVLTVDTATDAVVGERITLPREASDFAASPDGQRLYVVEYSYRTDPENQLWVLDLAQGTVRGRIDVGGRAMAVAMSADGRRAAVINWGSDRLSLIDPGTDTVVAAVALGQPAAAVVLSADGARAYVAVEGASIVLVIDTVGHTVIDRIRVNPDPRHLELSADGKRLFVASGSDSSVWVAPVG